jgi:CDP-diacylglycerol pyrophosphatase
MRLTALAAVALLISACGAPAAPDLPPPPMHPNGGALWKIVHDQCAPGQEGAAKPAPCAKVDLTGGEARGFAVLKDRHGAEQFLVMPTADITGIEDPALLSPGAPNRFAQAWSAKPLVDGLIGRQTPRDWMAVSVNSIYGRSQDLLHLHVDCLSPQAHADIAAAESGLKTAWSQTPMTIAGHRYYVRRLSGAAPAADPFRLLAEGIPKARGEMGAWTLVMAGADFDGRPGFVILAGRADPVSGEMASGETLQDHGCALAHGG